MNRSTHAGRADVSDLSALVFDLTGWHVRQLHDEARLVGVPGWRIGVCRLGAPDRAALMGCWNAVAAKAADELMSPVLLFRVDGDEWRAVWPSALQLFEQRPEFWTEYEWAVEASIGVWAEVAREMVPRRDDVVDSPAPHEHWMQRWPQ